MAQGRAAWIRSWMPAGGGARGQWIDARTGVRIVRCEDDASIARGSATDAPGPVCGVVAGACCRGRPVGGELHVRLVSDAIHVTALAGFSVAGAGRARCRSP